MTEEVLAAARDAARAMADSTNGEWATITMQMSCQSGGASFRGTTNLGEHVRADFTTLLPLQEKVLRSAAARAGTIEMVLRASGEFELNYIVGDKLRSPASPVFDTEFRLPGHPRPGMPRPPAARHTGEPTGPATLAVVSALVEEFKQHYTEITGSSPPWEPGYSEEEISAVESQLGLRLPEDLRALYRVVRDVEETGLLGRYSAISLKAVAEYYLEGEPGSLGWDDDLFHHSPVVFETDPPKTVKRLSRNDWWVTFGRDFGMNNLAVDLDPAELGHAGQILEYGRDIYGPVRYVASSVTDMLTQVVESLRAGRYESHEDSAYLETSVRFEDGVEQRSHDESLHDFGNSDLSAAVAELDHPELIQRLTINDTVELDLAALAPLSSLRELSVNRASSVLPRLSEVVSLEALEITAENVDLGSLAGHPLLWHLVLNGCTAPVDIRPLRTLPNLIKLDLSGVDVVNIEEVADLAALRVLSLNPQQWQRLRDLGRTPTGLAAAACTGTVLLADAVEWGRAFADEPGYFAAEVHTLISSV